MTSSDSRSMRERMLAGDLYVADDPDLARESASARTQCHLINLADPSDAGDLRARFVALLGSFGEGSEIRPPFQCDYGYQTHLGERVFANFGLMCLDVARIEIGDDTQIGPNVQLLTPTHPLEAQPRLDKWEAALPITIGRNVWLGGGVIVCPGVTIGDHAVVGAGAVVTRDIPAYAVAVGNPARVIKTTAPSGP